MILFKKRIMPAFFYFLGVMLFIGSSTKYLFGVFYLPRGFYFCIPISIYLICLLMTFPKRRAEAWGLMFLLKIGFIEVFWHMITNDYKPYRLMDRPSYRDGVRYEYRIYPSVEIAWYYARLSSWGWKPVHHPPHKPGDRSHFHSHDKHVNTSTGPANIHFSYGDPIQEHLFERITGEDGQEMYRLRRDNSEQVWPHVPRLLFDM